MLAYRTPSSLISPACQESTSYGLSGCRSPGGQLAVRSPRQRLIAQHSYSPDNRPATTATEREPWRQYSRPDVPPPRNSPAGPPPPPPTPPPSGGNGFDSFTKALVAAAFIVGLGTGVYFDSEITLHPSNVASTELVDRRTPNSELCMAYGYSAMVFDQRLFVSLNPFNVYVTQPEILPGCVLRRSNVNILEKKQLVDDKQVESCKRSMNTFAFVGDLDKNPTVSCVYHSEEAENQYLQIPDRILDGAGPSGAPVKLPLQATP